MPTKKPPVIEEEIEELPQKLDLMNSTTVAVPKKEEKAKGPMVDIFLPELPGGDSGVKVDQYEHVTIANELGEVCYKVHRGETVSVPVPVFLALKARYPKI